jgi:hypothetical protein
MTAFSGSLRETKRRWMARLAATLVLALALLAAFAGLLREQVVEAVSAARQQTSLAATGVAAALDASLARFSEQALAVRPADLGPDRLAQTARLLRWQTLLPAGAATFLLSPDGQLLAASAPFQRQDASVAGQSWFQQAQASERLGLQTLDRPWLGIADGFVVARVVKDAGKPAAVVGAVLPRAAVTALVGPDWLPARGRPCPGCSAQWSRRQRRRTGSRLPCCTGSGSPPTGRASSRCMVSTLRSPPPAPPCRP